MLKKILLNGKRKVTGILIILLPIPRMSGVTHTLLLGNKINLKTGAGFSYTKNGYDEDYIEDDYSISKNYTDNYIVKKWLFNSTMNYKFSNRLQLRAGVIAQSYSF